MARAAGIGEGAFVAGTRIALNRAEGAAEKPVEMLAEGEAVATCAGEAGTRPVRRIVPHRVDHPRHPQPALVTPVRLRPGALGREQPRRELLLPVEALILVRELATPALVPAGALLNGSSVTRAPPSAALTWFGLELDAHDVVLAEGLPVASVRTDGRCARLLLPGSELAALRTRLAALALEGAPAEPEAADAAADELRPLRLLADGREIAPRQEPVDGVYRFVLPEGTGAVRLVSPARGSPAPRDSRKLGVAVTEVELDGTALALEAPEFGRGFHPAEGAGDNRWRWTDGGAWLVLPHSRVARRLTVTITDWWKNLRK